MPSRARPSSRRAARDFLDRIREVCGLVADVSLGAEWPGADRLIVGHRISPPSYRGQPVRLSNGMYLNIEIALQVGRSSQRLETTAATFTYQAGADNDDPRPVFAYHFDKNSRSGYPRCHMHVHATPHHYRPARPFSRLHLPTRRLTLEQIVWHLIQEHGVQPRRADWHQVLWRHETWFRNTQRNKPWPYDPPFGPPANHLDPLA